MRRKMIHTVLISHMSHVFFAATTLLYLISDLLLRYYGPCVPLIFYCRKYITL